MADKLLRFKDILEMDGQENPLDRPKLSFDDLHVSQYRPGEDELTNYRAYRRRRVHDVGSDTATYSESVEHEETDLVENLQKKMKQKKAFLKNKARIRRGKELAKRRMKNKKQLMKLTRQIVRREFFKKLTKGIPKSQLTYAVRANYEKRLNSPPMMRKQEIAAKKMFPKVYKAELAKKRGSRDPK
jgi:hypothetical protein